MVKQNEKFSNEIRISENTSKVLQEAFQKTKNKIVELERNQHQLEQYSRRECLDFSGIPNALPPKELESFGIHALEEIGIMLIKFQITACHRLGRSERTIVNFVNRKDDENIR